MYRPECKEELTCGCKSCRDRGEKPNMMVMVDRDNETEACPFCNFTMHIDG